MGSKVSSIKPEGTFTEFEARMSSSSAKLPQPPVPPKPITLAIVGAGNRGAGYAKFATYYPNWLKVVAVCDHRPYRCNQLATEHKIPPENIFIGDWSLLAAKGQRLADAVAICTPDRVHLGPTLAFAALKYNILLEKPMSINVEECVQIYKAIKDNNVLLAVGHVLRYTNYMKAFKAILDSGELGQIINVQHLEPVGFWHFAHSFVRGNWHNENDSSFSLLAKSCHDIDLIPYMVGSQCKKVSSFGNLKYFRRENKPKEAGDAKSCLDCVYEPKCPYSAKKIYLDSFKKGVIGWPNNVVQPNGTIDIENLTEGIKSTSYGTCVYEMDNDVCDHQVVNMEFVNGTTASFTMVAFTEAICERKTKVFGSHGELEGDGVDEIKVYNFRTKQKRTIRPSEEPTASNMPDSSHGGGDFGLMQAFLYACTTGNQDYILSGPKETLDSHLYVFAAEEARKTDRVVLINDYIKSKMV